MPLAWRAASLTSISGVPLVEVARREGALRAASRIPLVGALSRPWMAPHTARLARPAAIRIANGTPSLLDQRAAARCGPIVAGAAVLWRLMRRAPVLSANYHLPSAS